MTGFMSHVLCCYSCTVLCHYWAYGKAGNGNETEMETENGNWKWKLETEMGTKNTPITGVMFPS